MRVQKGDCQGPDPNSPEAWRPQGPTPFPTLPSCVGRVESWSQEKGKLEGLTFAPMTAISAVGQA